jgi:hypothetical protein
MLHDARPAEAEPDVSYDPAARALLLRTAPARLGWIRSACAVPTPPAPRAASPAAPRRASGSADTRGAFHRRASPVGYAWTFAHDAGLSPRFVRRAGSFPQVVTSLWKTHGALCRLRSAARLLTSRSLRKPRSPWWPRSWSSLQGRLESSDARGMRPKPHPRRLAGQFDVACPGADA